MARRRKKKSMKTIPIPYEPLQGHQNCYILSVTDNGDMVCAPATVTVLKDVGAGITRPQIIELNGEIGFQKDSRSVDDSDDLEMIINYLGRLLGIKMAQAYRCFAPDGTAYSLISISVAQPGESVFITMRKALSIVAQKVKCGELRMPEWADAYEELLNNKAYPDVPDAFESRAISPEDIRLAIDVGLYVIAVIAGKDSRAVQTMKSDYFKMILLDAITGQVDRTMENYGLVCDNKTKWYSFAPLFDNATLAKPYTKPGECMVNGIICDRSQLIRSLMSYPDSHLQTLINAILDNKNELLRKVLYMSARLLDDEQNVVFAGRFIKGLNLLSAHR